MVVEIKEMIEFAGFNTREYNMFLVNRDAPSPEEKEIIEDIPFSQGVFDFSMIFGERFFKNRDITYEFLLIEHEYRDRAEFETMLKQRLLPHGIQKLYDSHDNSFYWLGKCKSIEVDHDHKFNTLRVTLEFDCYPFMMSINTYFDDIWDNFYFVKDIANFTKYDVKGARELMLINISNNEVPLEVIASSEMKLSINGDDYTIASENNLNRDFSLKSGENKIFVEGTGLISFRWRSEVLG